MLKLMKRDRLANHVSLKTAQRNIKEKRWTVTVTTYIHVINNTAQPQKNFNYVISYLPFQKMFPGGGYLTLHS